MNGGERGDNLVLNHKGGVGKTTMLFNAAIEMHRLGMRVLMVDLDAHANSLYGSKNIVKNATPSKTGAIEISLQGDPDKLLDYAFRALRVVEAGIGGLERISS
ncbi:ParA family protein [Mycobacterium canetti]|uniref:ParA family protein n=1 Tax=Mycobacterium canetti TaxID=78331 RepID=UPI0002A57272|nr:AAA family ATPase [Mycobacterium canetti]WRO42089.1 hypothetical protein MUW33_2140 [Mycobacterium canetti]CCK60115.1 Protein of unknown function [Mycobacterium canettii CIPT 140070010]